MEALFSTFSDATVYFLMAVSGTLLFLLRFIMMLVGGDHGDFHVETSDMADGHGSGFSLFSLLSIVAFMMGAGWMGVACRVEWHFGALVSAALSSGFGFALMLLCSVSMYQMRKFNEVGGYDVKHVVGHVGRVYLRIPAKGQGRGQVEITVDGRRKVLYAVSNNLEIASFTAVRVLGVEADETLVVEPQA
ncbi:MAG: hypothetical protein ACKVX7_10345 [Planctomycetota bacterium]